MRSGKVPLKGEGGQWSFQELRKRVTKRGEKGGAKTLRTKLEEEDEADPGGELESSPAGKCPGSQQDPAGAPPEAGLRALGYAEPGGVQGQRRERHSQPGRQVFGPRAFISLKSSSEISVRNLQDSSSVQGRAGRGGRGRWGLLPRIYLSEPVAF